MTNQSQDGGIPVSVLVAALSRALDLTEGEPLGHSLRTAWIGLSIAKALQLSAPERNDLFYALLLKDAGCTANAHQVSEWFGTDDRSAKYDLKVVNWTRFMEAARYAAAHARPDGPWLSRLRQMAAVSRRGPGAARRLVEMRCTRGADLVRQMGWVDLAPDAVLNLDEHWDGSGHPAGLRGEAIPRLARVLLLAQQVEIFRSRFGSDAARSMARQRRGRWFDPELVDAFWAISDAPSYWQAVVDINDPRVVVGWEVGDTRILHSTTDLLPIAQAFAEIVDAKSPWTHAHSVRTAEYSRRIAERMGLTEEECLAALLAGFYHDLGKLGVSNLVLDKPGPLSAAEVAQVRRHPALTAEILTPLDPLAEVAQVAAAHHERLDGSGYHQGLTRDTLPLLAQVVAAADVFDALTSERPYKTAQDPDSALRLMGRDAPRKLSAPVLTALAEAVTGERDGSGGIPQTARGQNH